MLTRSNLFQHFSGASNELESFETKIIAKIHGERNATVRVCVTKKSLRSL